MSITQRGIYWKNDWVAKTAKNSYKWEEIQNFYSKIEKKSGDILFEPDVLFDIRGSNYPGVSLVNLIKALTCFFIESSQEAGVAAPPLERDQAQPTVAAAASLSSPRVGAAEYETALINGL